MTTETISFIPELDMVSDSRKRNLCRTWKKAYNERKRLEKMKLKETEQC